jgi:two-component system sensor histidine kinase KdpD
MTGFLIYKINKPLQFLITIFTVCIIAGICFVTFAQSNYEVVAFVLLFTVSLIAMFFDILPVLLAAFLSALIWDFFFIPPRFTLQVGRTEDTVLLLMYFVIALLNAVLTYKIRQFEKIVTQKEEKANTIKLYNTLLNSLSHELRTPIATILGATDNLQTRNSKLTAEHKNELLNEISKASMRLNMQVENLLNMSRLESGFIKPKKNWTDITELVYNIVKKIEENNITQKINININPSIPLFKLDEGMLEHIIFNLLNNACLYTPPKTVINVVAICHEDVLQIIIEDDGNGFPADEIDFVFDKFYRLKNTKPGGTGLGLSIAKGFTEAMKGTLQLQNKTTGGARFTIDLQAETSYLKNLKNE